MNLYARSAWLPLFIIASGAISHGQTSNTEQRPIINSIGMKLAPIPAGDFLMGSPESEAERSDDEVQHHVEITQHFYMGVFEVTQDEFERVMDDNPSGFRGEERLPVENVSWEDAVEFCRRLSAFPREKNSGRRYRLPTEAEWEYACRANTNSAFCFGDTLSSGQANFDGSAPYGVDADGQYLGKTAPVGSYEANAFGLYDMHGNVWEWCSDWYSEEYFMESPVEDPKGPSMGTHHVIRGGSWYNFGHCLRSAYRYEFTPPLDNNFYGFRVVCIVEQPVGNSWTASLVTSSGKGGSNDTSNPLGNINALAWLAALVLVLVLGDFRRIAGWRNVDLMVLLVTAVFLYQSMPLIGICTLIVYLAGRIAVCRDKTNELSVNLAARPLILLLVMLCVLHVYFVLSSPSAEQSTVASAVDSAATQDGNQWRSFAFKLIAMFCDGLVIGGLILLGRRWQGLEAGLSLAIVYAVLPCTIFELPNMWYVAMTAAVVGALLFRSSPIQVGMLLATAAAAHFAALFLVPLWIAQFERKDRWRLGAGVLAIGVVCVAGSWFVAADVSLLSTDIESEQFHFWENHPFLLLPHWLILFLYALICMSLATLPREKISQNLCPLTGLVLLGTQLWVAPGIAPQLQWFAPCLVIALTSGLRHSPKEEEPNTVQLSVKAPTVEFPDDFGEEIYTDEELEAIRIVS